MPKKLLSICLALAAVLPAAGQHVLELDALMGKLRGDDDRARAEARVLLPRAGLAAAPALFAALEDPRPEVWWAAYAVIADLCNASAAAGNKADQRSLGAQVLALMAPERTDHLKTQGLRLLPVVASKRLDLGPVADLLRDPEHRERARQALQETGTEPARTLLREALDGADPAFEAALLLALGQLQDEPALPMASARLRHPDPAVRAAAALAVAWAGRVSDRADLLAAYRAADAATRADTGDAVLRHADALATQGGTWTLAMETYRLVLREETGPARQAAALTGLATHGDETVVPDILAAVRAEGREALYGPAATALAALRGRAGRKAALAAYPDLPDAMRPAALGALARTRDPLVVPLLEEAAQAGDPALRETALAGLARSGAPQAVDVLAAALESAEGGEHARLYAWVKNVAEDCRGRGDAAAAGRAYLALYRHAADGDARAAALDGVKQFPTAEAYDVLLETTTAEERQALPVEVIAAIARALHEGRRTAEADEFVGMLWARAGEPAVIHALRGLDGALGGALGVDARLGFLEPWRTIGPFPWAKDAGFQEPVVPVDRVEAAASYPGKQAEAGWSEARPAPGGLIDLSGAVGMEVDATAFAACVVKAESDSAAELRLGSDDGVRAWVNGEEVHRNDTDRGAALDQDIVPVQLRAGDNLVVLEISQNGGGWNFIARLTGLGGAPLAFQASAP